MIKFYKSNVQHGKGKNKKHKIRLNHNVKCPCKVLLGFLKRFYCNTNFVFHYRVPSPNIILLEFDFSLFLTMSSLTILNERIHGIYAQR